MLRCKSVHGARRAMNTLTTQLVSNWLGSGAMRQDAGVYKQSGSIASVETWDIVTFRRRCSLSEVKGSVKRQTVDFVNDTHSVC